MREEKKKIIRVAASVVLAVAIGGIFTTGGRGSGVPYYRVYGDTLRCSIATNHGMFAKEKNNAGFNYELLKAFGSANGLYMMITPPVEQPECWEQLADGRYDIIVLDSKDTLPEKYRKQFYFSAPVKDNDVWAVTRENNELVNSINFWYSGFQSNKFFKRLTSRYFRSYNIEKLVANNIPVTGLSPYDDIIKKYSSKIGIDWRLLSSIIYQESRYSIGASSSKDAKGLMQIKESTSAKYGISDLYDPDNNVRAGTMHFGNLLKQYKREGLDSVNVIKMALAAYHGGEARIDSLRSSAERKGFNPNDWDSMLQSFKVQNGPTSTYIKEILDRYELYKTLVD